MLLAPPPTIHLPAPPPTIHLPAPPPTIHLPAPPPTIHLLAPPPTIHLPALLPRLHDPVCHLDGNSSRTQTEGRECPCVFAAPFLLLQKAVAAYALCCGKNRKSHLCISGTTAIVRLTTRNTSSPPLQCMHLLLHMAGAHQHRLKATLLPGIRPTPPHPAISAQDCIFELSLMQ
jgi:hypothetical protein